MAGPVDQDDWPFRAGDEIEGRYRIVRPLQAGGVGVVYEAEHKWSGLSVALKALFKRVGDHPDRMRAEARTLAGISHPNVVPITDGDVTTELSRSSGVVWFTMPLLQGRNLRQELNERGALELTRALRFGIQIAEGCAAAHALDVVHRDLKPENVFVVAADDSVKILDFGVSKIRNKLRPAELRTTDRHRLLGTEAYMAPELLQVGASDARSDVYAVGHILYEMLAGRHCWSEGPGPLDLPPKMALGLRQIYTPASSVRSHAPHVPDYVDAIVLRALEKEPAARQQSMKELALELGEALKRVGSAPSVAVVPQAPVLTERMATVHPPEGLVPVRASGPVAIAGGDSRASMDAALVCGTARFAAEADELSDNERGMRILAAVEARDARFRGMLGALAADMSKTPENARAGWRRALKAMGSREATHIGAMLHDLRRRVARRGWVPDGESVLSPVDLVQGAALLLEPELRSDTAESAVSLMGSLDEDTHGFACAVLIAFARAPIDSHATPRRALLALALGSPSDSEVARAELADFVLSAANARDLGVEMQSVDLAEDDADTEDQSRPNADAGATPTPASMTTPADSVRSAPRGSRVSAVVAFGIAITVAVLIAIAGLALKKKSGNVGAPAPEATMTERALASAVPTLVTATGVEAVPPASASGVAIAPKLPTSRPEPAPTTPHKPKETPREPAAPSPATAKGSGLPSSGL